VVGGSGRQCVQGIAEPTPGFGAELQAGGGETGEDREGAAAAVAAEEQPVLASDGERLDRPLGNVVIDR
jgi:hypothetical protein